MEFFVPKLNEHLNPSQCIFQPLKHSQILAFAFCSLRNLQTTKTVGNCFQIASGTCESLGWLGAPSSFCQASLLKKWRLLLWAFLPSSSGPEPRNTFDTSLTRLHFRSAFKSYCLYLLTNVLRVALALHGLAEVLCWNSVDLYSCSFNTSRSLLPSLIYAAQNNRELVLKTKLAVQLNWFLYWASPDTISFLVSYYPFENAVGAVFPYLLTFLRAFLSTLK